MRRVTNCVAVYPEAVARSIRSHVNPFAARDGAGITAPRCGPVARNVGQRRVVASSAQRSIRCTGTLRAHMNTAIADGRCGILIQDGATFRYYSRVMG